MKTATDGIRVIHEDIDDDPVFKEAHELLRKAECVIFLGFGYHPKNVERLRLPEHFSGFVEGTTFGITKSEFESKVVRMFQGNNYNNLRRYVSNENQTVLGFLRNNNHLFI